MCAALALAVAGLGVNATVTTARAADPVAQVWVTTADGGKKLAAEGNVPFDGTPQGVDIRIDAGSKGQRFTGAGASVTGASAHLIQGLPQAQRTTLLRSLFSARGRHRAQLPAPAAGQHRLRRQLQRVHL